MDCPRCGGTLSSYRLADAETVACDDCIYVGVPVDHTSEGHQRESWTEALDRFYQRHHTSADDETAPTSDAVKPVFETTGEATAADGDAVRLDSERTRSADADGATATDSETASVETTQTE